MNQSVNERNKQIMASHFSSRSTPALDLWVVSSTEETLTVVDLPAMRLFIEPKRIHTQYNNPLSCTCFFFFFFSFAYVLCFRQREEKDARKTKEVLSQTEKFDSTHSVLMNFVPVYSRGNAMNHESKDKEKLQLDSPIAIHNR